MKILIGTHHYPPDYVAGVELLTQRLALWMLAHGHEVEVVTIERIDATGPLTVDHRVQDGVLVHRLQISVQDRHFGLRHRDPELERWFEGFLVERRPDVFHSQSSYLLSGSLIEAARHRGVAVVASLHDYWYLCPRITLLRSNGDLCSGKATADECAACLMSEQRRYRWTDAPRRWLSRREAPGSIIGPPLKPWWPLEQDLVATVGARQAYLDGLLRSVDQIVTPARLVYDLLLERGFSPEHVRLVRQGMAGAPGQRETRAAGEPRRGLRIGFLGQVAPHKGIHLLVEAFQQLTAPGAAPQLSIFGNLSILTSYVRKLEHMANNNPRIAFRGTYSNENVHDVLDELDVVVVPSLWYEISPLVILESFAAGVPVVASDLRNMNYQVRDERDGLLFKPHSATDLARQLQRLIDEPALLEKLRAGIQPTHPVDAEMRELEAIYGDVAGRSAAGALAPAAK